MLAPLPLGFLFGRKTDVLSKLFEPGHLRIRCPECGWQPARTDIWVCSPGCGHAWNTFETSGICPSCSKGWTYTACHRCGVWSPHEAWYDRDEARKPST